MNIHKLKFPLYSTLCIISTLLSSMPFITAQTGNITVQRIWNTAPHNAFTDLVRFKGQFYCTFREGTGHVPGEHGKDGKIRIISSRNGRNWKSVALIEKTGLDLRDPKISITPDGRLMLLIGATDYDGKQAKALVPHVCFSDKKGRNLSIPQPIQITDDIRSNWNWLWRVTWYKGKAYGIVYQSVPGSPSNISLVQTEDGINYSLVKKFDVGGNPNEATIRFMPEGEMLIYLRRKQNGLLGRSRAPFTQWNWQELDMRLGGPNFIRLPFEKEKLIFATRVYDPQGAYTALFEGNRTGQMKEIVHLPSSGDTSYAGLVYHKKYLYVSYYSSHEEKTSIYLAKMALEVLRGEE